MSVNDLRSLIDWFPSGTAEGERAILEKVFVYVDEFSRVLAPPIGNPYLLVGSKGTGKSAILDFASRLLERQGVPVVTLQPFDIETSSLTDGDSMGDMARKFYNVCISAIAGKLADNASGLLVGDAATLYNHAVAAGTREPGLLGRVARSLSEIAKPVTNVDISKSFNELYSNTKKSLEAAISGQLNDKRFYLFIDDTDQVANPSQPGHLNRIWALILAIRELASRVPEVRAVITLRSEIWARLQRDSAGQRDQTDHFLNLTVTLRSDKKKIDEIISRRLDLAARSVNSQKNGYLTFFEGAVARAPFSEDRRSWEDLITVRARDRPRDAIQLVGMLARHAISERHERIEEADFQAVMPVFSEDRAKLFAREAESECSNALEVIRTFADVWSEEGGFRYTAKETLDVLRRSTTKFGVTLYGIKIRPDNEADILELWRFLYTENVLNARVKDAARPMGYRHLDAGADPTLVSKARWNEMQAVLWEINPAYRDFVMRSQSERIAGGGLPVKPPRQKRRR